MKLLAAEDLAMLSITEDCVETGNCLGYWPGSNAHGQIWDWYLGAPDCGIVDPIESTAVSEPLQRHLIQVVNGDADSCDPPTVVTVAFRPATDLAAC